MRALIFVIAIALVGTAARADSPDEASIYSPLMLEADIGPVIHTAPRDQGKVGFCWAYSIAGFMEGEALKQGKQVTLSPEYLAIHHLPNLLYTFLPMFESLDFEANTLLKFAGRALVDAILVMLVDPEGAITLSEALSDAKQAGMVPESVFNVKFQDANQRPTLRERVQIFMLTRLLIKQQVQFYMKNPEIFRKDFFNAIGIRVPQPTSTFVYEGKTYTPMTFMKDYLQFEPSSYVEVTENRVSKNQSLQQILSLIAKPGLVLQATNWPKPLVVDHDQVLKMARASLEDGRAVPVAMIVFDDLSSAESRGVFSNANCDGGKCSKIEGGHAVLATGMKLGANGSIDALIVKNSWGDIGLNEFGQATNENGARGFFLVTPDYLQSGAEETPNGFSILVNKKYVQAGL